MLFFDFSKNENRLFRLSDIIFYTNDLVSILLCNLLKIKSSKYDLNSKTRESLRDINYLETARIGSLIWKFSIPTLVGMIANASYNVVDRIIVGRGVGTEALSAITLTFPITLIVLAFAMLIGIGAAAVVSIKLGEKNQLKSEEILGNSFTIAILLSILITSPILLFFTEVLSFFSAEGIVLDYASDYLSIILIAIPFQILAFTLNAIIRGEGNPRISMLTMLVAAILNIILDYILVIIFNFGITGAAWATFIAQFISFAWVFYYFVGKKSLLKFRLINLIPTLNNLSIIFVIGISPFLMHLASSILFFIANKKLLIYGGEVSVGAMGIINSIALFIFMPIFGINQGIQPIIGYNYGAKKYKRVKEALTKGMTISTFICTSGFLFAMIFSKELIGLFSQQDNELISIGSRGLSIALSMLPLVGFQVILGAYFQAIGKAGKAVLLTLSRQVLFILPLMIVLPIFFGLDGLWAFSPVADFLSALIAFYFMYLELKRLKYLIDNNC